MNETIKNILNRRSVRVYSDEQIKQEDLDIILKAGYYAPSGCNCQPWHFTVVQNKEILDELNVETKKELIKLEMEQFQNYGKNENFSIFYNAPTVVVVSGEKSAVIPQVDCAAATQNMLLAAESLNIGSCWVGLLTYLLKSERAQEYTEMLHIPEGYEPYYAITLGYKKYSDPSPKSRREGIVSYIK